MIPEEINNLIGEIAEAMVKALYYVPIQEESYFGFDYNGHGFAINGSGRIGGESRSVGDGYWAPYETEYFNCWGELNDLSIYDEETDTEADLTDEVVDTIFNELNKILSDYMNAY